MNEQLKSLLNDWHMECVYVVPTEEQLKPENRRLRYQVDLYCRGAHVLTTPYIMGVGHIPGWDSFRAGPRLTIHNDASIRAVLKAGSGGLVSNSGALDYKPGEPIRPELADVLYCVVCDAAAIDYADFEDWAPEYGYDSDSRSAEATYRTCLNIALRLRAALGDAGLQALRDAFQDY